MKHFVGYLNFFLLFLLFSESALAFRNVVVTGGNRGIGLEFVKQLLQMNPAPKNVIATSRKTSIELDNLKKQNPNLHQIYYDATNYTGYGSLVEQVQKIVADDGVSVLVNNAGIFIHSSLESVKPEDMMKNIEVNAVAPLILTQSLLPLLKASAGKNTKTIIINISSKMGSIDMAPGGEYAYRTSKAAMNMIGKSMAQDLKNDKIIVLQLHPGWVQTDLGTQQAPLTPTVSVNGMLSVIHNSTLETTGSFIDYSGKKLPW